MPLDEFKIVFDNPSKTFLPGQVVSGLVIVSSTVETKTQGLRIKCIGQATCHWAETATQIAGNRSFGGTVTDVPLYFDSSENYFDFEIYAEGDGKSESRIPPGRNEYPFTFTLPPRLPTSYVGALGKVTYDLMATIKRSWKFDKEVKEGFAVTPTLDLSRYPSAKEPITRQSSTQFCCCCCESGPVGFEINLPKGGFLPGESLGLSVKLLNGSGRGLPGPSVILIQKQIFSADKRVKAVCKDLQEFKGPSVDPKDETVWSPDIRFPVDSVPTKLGGGCAIMDVQYYINFFLNLPSGGMATVPKEEMSVIIGTK